MPHQELLGSSLLSLLSEPEAEITLRSLLHGGPQNPRILTLLEKQFVSFCHVSGNELVLECEPYLPYSDQEKLAHTNILAQLHPRLGALRELGAAADVVAETMLEVLQYDRVNVIRFDADWNSEVLGESRTSRLCSFVGHFFPASDIPLPARELLRQKHVRQIANVDAPAVGITPYLNPTTGQPTNILQAELRNPSEMHLEYIRNTGVAATISFSIIVKGQLWGVITCHHQNPAFADVWKRQLCDLIAKSFANIVASIQEIQDSEQFIHFKQVEQILVARLSKSKEVKDVLLEQEPGVLDLTDGSGVALQLDGTLTTAGQTPSEEQLQELMRWISEQESKKVYYTQQLSKEYPAAAAFQEVASGLLAVEISRYSQEYLLFFKPEIKETRIWAGNPEKPLLTSRQRFHPRKSFEQWKEIVKGKSLSWTLNELEISQLLVKDLIAIRLRNQAEKLKVLNQELKGTAELLQANNQQLKEFASVMSHNLRSPLANIEGFYQIYSRSPTPETAAFSLTHIKQVTVNMFKTIEDLHVILRAQLIEDLPTEFFSLTDVIEKEKQNLEVTLLKTGAEIKEELLVPAITAPRVYLESILHNFISNALKYRSPDRSPEILIRTWLKQGLMHLSITDNGLGMDLERVGRNLFGMYKTFHKHEHAKGLGLYLTKLQVKALGGAISVMSAPNQGTTFTLVFKDNPQFSFANSTTFKEFSDN